MGTMLHPRRRLCPLFGFCRLVPGAAVRRDDEEVGYTFTLTLSAHETDVLALLILQMPNEGDVSHANIALWSAIMPGTNSGEFYRAAPRRSDGRSRYF